jgi:hypothetical protein
MWGRANNVDWDMVLGTDGERAETANAHDV